MSLKTDRRLTNSLWDRIRRGAERIDDELPRMKAKLNAVNNATAYRPSAAHSPTVVSLLWAHANSKAPDDLQRTARALADALQVEGVGGEGDERIAVSRAEPPVQPDGGARAVGVLSHCDRAQPRAN